MKETKEHSYSVHYNGDIFKVNGIRYTSASSLDTIIKQIMNELIYSHDQWTVDTHIHTSGIAIHFLLDKQWHSLCSKEQLNATHTLRMTPCVPPPPSLPSLLYVRCEWLHFGREVLFLSQGVDGLVPLKPESHCNNKWCHCMISRNGVSLSRQCLIIRGESQEEIIAVYCSLRCAMYDRKETLEHVREQTLLSFRFLLQRSRKEIRLMRILKVIHDNVESWFRSGQQRGEPLSLLSSSSLGEDLARIELASSLYGNALP